MPLAGNQILRVGFPATVDHVDGGVPEDAFDAIIEDWDAWRVPHVRNHSLLLDHFLFRWTSERIITLTLVGVTNNYLG